jgi:reductive dehalogenase
MAVEMDYDATRYSPDAISGAATGLGYSLQAVLANFLATFIRGLGFQAIPSGNDTALSIPLAMAAGLGELGRMGLLLTEKYGPRVRLCKVFTDLPLEYDTYRPFGVQEFCKVCKKCAIHCPSKAISYDDPTEKGSSISNHSGVLKWYIHPENCFLFWVKNWMDCNNCVKVCPFNKPQGMLHDSVRAVIRKMPQFDRLIVWMDDLLGYGKPVRDKNFWEKP